jgi:methylated-DNA-[protein]-cysteine S-methyltransferase
VTKRQAFQYNAPFGALSLSFEDKRFVGLAFSVPENSLSTLPAWASPACQFLDQYFSQKQPSIPALSLQGTAFQVKVWSRLASIPYGHTLTYGDLAKELDSAPRAIGQAVKRNPFPLYLPCHRVVAKAGVGGFDGHSQGRLINIKQWLLDFESEPKRNHDA